MMMSWKKNGPITMLALAAACGGEVSTNPTTITLAFLQPQLDLRQIELTAETSDGPLFEHIPVPEVPSSKDITDGRETFVIELPADYDRGDITFFASAAVGETVVSWGRASADPVLASDTTLAVTMQRASCGDGVVTAPEQCDPADFRTGGACNHTCEVVEVAEVSRLQFISLVSSPPSQASPIANCGNGVLEPGEVCEPSMMTNETCLSMGLLPGANTTAGPTCRRCAPVINCGAVIESVGQIREAFQLIIRDHTVREDPRTRVHLRPGRYDGAGSVLQFPTCGLNGAGSAGGGNGNPVPAPVPCESVPAIELAPHSGFVSFENLSVEIASSGHRLAEIGFFARRAAAGATTAVLSLTAEATNNVIASNLIELDPRHPMDGLVVFGGHNEILGNAVYRTAETGVAPIGTAMAIVGAGNSVAMNVIGGNVQVGLRIGGGDVTVTPNAETLVDHNTVAVGEGRALVIAMPSLCVRNNLLNTAETPSAMALVIEPAYAPGQCSVDRIDLPVVGNYIIGDGASQCSSNGAPVLCRSLCGTGQNRYGCQILAPPRPFTAELVCLDIASESGRRLHDAAIDLGYNLSSRAADAPCTGAGCYVGRGPDVGAREHNAARTFARLDDLVCGVAD